jgi:protein-S-isoprenylcysteine O-methyltransferase Ste14
VHTKNLVQYLAIMVTVMTGVCSLLLFGLFVFGRSFTLVEFGYGALGSHAWNALLCLLFFIQHSAMVRRAFRDRLMPIVPHHYQGALYTLASGVVLIALVLLWQNSQRMLVALQGEWRWVAFGISFGALIGIVWAMRALRSFDVFGIRPILAHVRAVHERTMPLTIRGPYRWVRHPLYFFILVLIWSCPDITTDRLLFNVLFTVWIVFGTRFEERDLVAEFGETYLSYQRRVPMLIPWKLLKPATAMH